MPSIALIQTGTVATNEFRITFAMWTIKTLANVNFTIRFTNGSQVCYVYDSYYADDIDQYKGGGVVTGWRPDTMFWLAILFAGTFGSIVVAVVFGGKGNLPNYGGK